MTKDAAALPAPRWCPARHLVSFHTGRMSETLILGLASIVSSGVVGSVGLYLVYHARSQPFRERLYGAQLALLSDIAERVIELDSICLVHRVQSDELARLKTFVRAAEVGKELGSLCSRAPKLPCCATAHTKRSTPARLC